MGILRTVRYDLANGQLPRQTDATLKALISRAVATLRAYGHAREAQEIEDRYSGQFENFLETQFTLNYALNGVLDLGDHKPLSEWLAVVTETLRLLLGDFIMEQTHLSDIRIVNYAIPVVLHPRSPDWGIKEYKRHFVPLSGVISYWSIWVACKIAGGFPIPMACSAVGSLGKSIMIYVFATSISDLVYQTANRGRTFVYPSILIEPSAIP